MENHCFATALMWPSNDLSIVFDGPTLPQRLCSEGLRKQTYSLGFLFLCGFHCCLETGKKILKPPSLFLEEEQQVGTFTLVNSLHMPRAWQIMKKDREENTQHLKL